jgi:hypothetical protein
MADPQYLNFREKDKPTLSGGDYTITVKHDIPTVGSEQPGLIGKTPYQFTIAAPRFTLNPQDIMSVFPPPGSLGDHSRVLPHIQFRRSTLPWERIHQEKNGKGQLVDGPWFALLVLYQGEPDTPGKPTWTVGDLQNQPQGTAKTWWTPLTKEIGSPLNPEAPVNIIEIDGGTFAKIFPTLETCNLLTHVRNNTETPGQLNGDERAVIIANRLPRAGGSTTVHLVSLEGHNLNNEIQNAKAGDKVRFISLYSWRFTCTSADHNLTGLLKNVNLNLLMRVDLASGDQDSLDKSQIPAPLMTAFQQIGRPLTNAVALSPVFKGSRWKIIDGIHEFHLTLETNKLRVTEKMPGVLRLPPNENADAEMYLKRGSVALAHEMHYGNRTVSWYHGPFMPGSFQLPLIQLPVQGAEELLYYNKSTGMLDVSYAAAWELGRLLTLQNKPVAAALYTWKRQHAQAQKLLDFEHQLMHLPLGRTRVPDDLPQIVRNSFKELVLLTGVPFRYLVPDERMLPPESLRFFQIDSMWINCLIDGAFSVGRVLASDYSTDQAYISHVGDANLPNPTSGLLLRSAVVSGWPDLLLAGQDGSGTAATKLREDKLSANLWLCLFQQQIKTVTLHLKPEALHFGLEGGPVTYERTLRDKKGDPVKKEVKVSSDGVVNWSDLQTNINSISSGPVTSAVIAFQMVTPSEQVQFTVS